MALLKTLKPLESPLARRRTSWDTPPTEADATVMAAFLRKDPAAAASLHERYGARIFGLGLSLLGNRTDAEDLVQDTFLKVWRTGSVFDPLRGSLDGWILMTARGLAIDVLRRRTLENKWLSSQPRHSETSDEPDPERFVEHRDSIGRARKAMDRLPPTQRAAVELAYFGERSSTQVARLEGIPLGTAKSRIRNGIATLRQILSADESVNRTTRLGACAGCAS